METVTWEEAGKRSEKESKRGSGSLLVLDDGERVTFAILSDKPVRWLQKWKGKGVPSELVEDEKAGSARYGLHVAVTKSSDEDRIDKEPKRYLWGFSARDMARLSRRVNDDGKDPSKFFFILRRSGTGQQTEYDLDPGEEMTDKQRKYIRTMAAACPDLGQDVIDTLFADSESASSASSSNGSADDFSDDEIPF